MEKEELEEILRKHKLYSNGESGGKKADLEGADLNYANFRKVDLSYVDFRKANLVGANFTGANLVGANLAGANLAGANLVGANLRSADLEGANLRGAYLEGANFRYAYLGGANLEEAELRETNFSCTTTDDRFIQISCIGRIKRMLTYNFDKDKVWCGCFIGTLEELEEEVKKTHKDNEQCLKEYLGAIKYIKTLR